MVTLETPCGPLALCGLKAWVGNTSNAAELLIDHEVMERLGFSENDFLSDAFAKQEGWDVSNVDKPSDFVRINRLTHAADANAERNRQRAVVEAVLKDKIQEPKTEGLSAAFLERLLMLMSSVPKSVTTSRLRLNICEFESSLVLS
ncbi:unnamed protein product, partial [Aphanomyces euteiches]